MIRLFRLSLLIMVMFALAMTAGAASWTGGKGPGYRGAFPDVAFPREPAVVWKSFLGADYVNLTPSNALVAGDLVIVAFDRILVALSAQTGEMRWTKLMDEKPLGDILLRENQVLVMQGRSGQLLSYNPLTGAENWRTKLPNGVRNPAVDAGDALMLTMKNNAIAMVEVKTGKLLGALNTGDKIESGPAVVNRSLVICYSEGRIARIDNGLNRWDTVIPGATFTQNPITDGKYVLANTNDRIIAVTPTGMDKAPRWIYYIADRLHEPMVLDGNRVYLATKNKCLVSLDLATGKDRWTHKVEVIDKKKAKTTLEKTTPEKTTPEKTTLVKPGLELPAKVMAQPIIVGNDLLVRMESGLLGAVNKDDGKLEWQFRLKSLVGAPAAQSLYAGAPAVVDDSLYFAGTDGVVYHLSSTAMDLDPPTITNMVPNVTGKGFINGADVQLLGAVVEDEGSGTMQDMVTVTLDNAPLPNPVKFDAASGYYYVLLDLAAPLAPGMHRMEVTAKDNRGNTGTLAQSFVLSDAATQESVVVKITGEFVPETLRVKPGTVIIWENHTGDARTVIADKEEHLKNLALNSDTLFPDGIPNNESWSWIVPTDIEIGSKIYYHCRIKGTAGDPAKQPLIEEIEEPKPATEGEKAGEGAEVKDEAEKVAADDENADVEKDEDNAEDEGDGEAVTEKPAEKVVVRDPGLGTGLAGVIIVIEAPPQPLLPPQPEMMPPGMMPPAGMDGMGNPPGGMPPFGGGMMF